MIVKDDERWSRGLLCKPDGVIHRPILNPDVHILHIVIYL